MSKLRILLYFSLFFVSCKNEIEVAAPWKETIVVYGLLDPAASVNYIRIQKAFLDPQGNAFQFTQVNDSIYPDDLKVVLYVRQNGNLQDSIFPVLIDGATDGITKDTGLFSNTPNYLYKISKPIKDSKLSPNAEDYEYEIVVTNPKTGFKCSSKAYTAGYLEPQAPVTSNTNNLTILDKSNTFMVISYREGRKVKAYDMILRFWYKETKKHNASDTTVKFFNWYVFKNRLTDPSLRGYEQKLSSVPGNIFYELLSSNIKADTSVNRKALYCDIEFYGAGEDLYTYIQVNQPSIGIIQKKPEYSNINNGLGIFSSRYVTMIKKIPLSADMRNTLRNSAYTKGLNF
jgi:hypothetical protein